MTQPQRLRAVLTRIAATTTAAVLALGGLAVAGAPAQAAGTPIAADDHYEMTTGTTLTLGEPGFMSNDSGVNPGAYLQLDEFTYPTVGTFGASNDSISAFGSFSYTPPAGFTGTATFTYSVRDLDAGLSSNTATVTIDVKPVGVPVMLPAATADDSYKYAVDTPLYIAAPGVLANDTLGGGATTVSLQYVPSNVDVVMSNDGSFLFTPPAGQSGLRWFRYRLCNPVACSIGEVVLNSTAPGEQPSGPSAPPAPVNAAPVAAKDTFAVTAGKTTVLSAAEGLLANDTDADHDALSVKSVSVSGPGRTEHGVVNDWSADGSITFTPYAGWSGTDRISYVLTDGSHEVTGTIDWVVSEPENYAPVALDDRASVRAGSTLRLPLGGVLANDTDLDGDTISVTASTAPAHGTATVAPGGELVYTPEPGFVGQDQLDYTVSDGTGGDGTDTGTVRIEVTAADAPLAPIAIGDRYHTVPHAVSPDGIAVAAPGLLRNDRSLSGQPLTVTTTGNNQYGTLRIEPDGSFTFAPMQGFTGLASFDYQISDGTSTATGSVAILVGGEPVPADPAPAAFASAPAPTVGGTAQVGKTITASVGAWNPEAEVLGYRWLRNGKPIPGATGVTYRLAAADVNTAVSLRVTAQRWGYATTERVSAAKKVAPARFTSTPQPKISGVAKKGRTLTAKAGSWKPGPVSLKYRWLRNGKAIAGATKSKYKLTAKDRGTRISVRITASKPGYATASRTSSVKRIAR